MASGLLILLDDIATVLDDVSVMTKVAAKKTAGILGDDLALNAQQVTGVDASRELPVVYAVAKGSLLNKGILVPAALLLSHFLPWAIEPLMIAGGTFLCLEGCEKIAHKWLHPHEAQDRRDELQAQLADTTVDVVALEKSKVRGAIRTDFILSAEIVVITLGSVTAASFSTQLGVLVAISILMTVGVYGLVAGIVKLDDAGMWLIKTPADRSLARWRQWIGQRILGAAPYLMRFLTIAGTAAMFLVGGGIVAHGIPWIHHQFGHLAQWFAGIETIGAPLAWGMPLLANAILGVVVGAIVLMIIHVASAGYRKIVPR